MRRVNPGDRVAPFPLGSVSMPYASSTSGGTA
jgi:hypothetical protein